VDREAPQAALQHAATQQGFSRDSMKLIQKTFSHRLKQMNTDEKEERI
jgi:hypothetical protein